MRRTTLGPINSGAELSTLDRSMNDSRMSFGAVPEKHHRAGGDRKSLGTAAATTKQAAPSTTKKPATQSRMSLGPGAPRCVFVTSLAGIKGPWGQAVRCALGSARTSTYLLTLATTLALPTLSPSRSMSLFGRHTGVLGAALVDARLDTPTFMKDSIDKLAKFLVDMDYPARITPMLLRSPTGKDIQGIISFLVRLFDPQFVLNTQPREMENDVHAVFKALKYPFPISKTSVTAGGSTQSWPALLGGITWLIELLEVGLVVYTSGGPEYCLLL